ncbi:MAG: glutamine synthetase type III [Ruminococcaceae bacterium]|nr:glutamine synthetase type III [Oscillospiraceae bacterium]
MIDVPSIFGIDVFNEQVMKERLDKDTYDALKATIKNGESLDINIANCVAKAMKEWAIEKGCTHYTHWFQPMTGITAEKHDSFLTPTDDGKVIMDFSGKALAKGESDASSFPNGGIRATFEARGYTAWDPTSYAFIKDSSLYIPTAFMSYTGEVLDKKTPLLRSMDRVSSEAVRILKLFGKTDVTRVTASVGAEQEYFLIDRKMYDRRKDLKYTGRTLFGARATKGQELEDHYFGAIKNRVSQFMKELDEQLWRLGIYSKTKHNEVAPAQHELAPIYTTTNIATDQNQLTMETMKTIARKHGMSCLLHEKPFANVNGSGKHNNWSLNTNTGENLLKPGKKPEENTQFLLFLAAVIKAVDEHQDLLRISVATAGNDHRLGSSEAPPAIISMHLGDDLEAIVDAIINNEDYESHGRVLFTTGVESMPDFKKDTSDRNRTSPFAFTGNKFEFRSLGSSISISCPNIMLNTIVADTLSQFADKLENAHDFDSACRSLIRKTFKAHRRIIFNGDGYTEDWVKEAEKRGLLNLKNTPDALEHFVDKKNIELFTRNHIYGETEVRARYEILLENYSKVIAIEAQTMINMAKKDIFPAVSKFTGELANTIVTKKAVSQAIKTDAEEALLKNMSELLSRFASLTDILEKNLSDADNHKSDPLTLAKYYRDFVLTSMNELREIGDMMETDMSTQHWPYPSYGDMLYSVQ